MCHVTKYLHTYVISKLNFSIPTGPNYESAILCCKIFTWKLPCQWHDNGRVQISTPYIIDLSLLLTSDTMCVLHFVERMRWQQLGVSRRWWKETMPFWKFCDDQMLTLLSDRGSILGYLTHWSIPTFGNLISQLPWARKLKRFSLCSES